MNHPGPGLGNASEFIVSPYPWLTASTLPSSGYQRYTLPLVTQYVILQNDSSGTIRLGFSPAVSGSKHMPVKVSGSMSLEVKTKEVYLFGTAGAEYSLFAGLTGIPAQQMFSYSTGMLLTGSSV